MWFGWLLRVRRISNTVKAHENSKYATIVSFYTESKENKNNILLMNNITKLLLQLIVANFFWTSSVTCNNVYVFIFKNTDKFIVLLHCMLLLMVTVVHFDKCVCNILESPLLGKQVELVIETRQEAVTASNLRHLDS